MSVRLVYRLFVQVLSWFALFARSPAPEDAEILATRHEVAVLQRNNPGPACPDQIARSWPRLPGCFPKALRAHRIVTPGTLLRWQRRLIAARWWQPKPLGRPPTGEELAALIVGLARENRTGAWFASRANCAASAIGPPASAIRMILRASRIPPSTRHDGTWRTFLRAQAGSLLAIGFFHAGTVTPKRLHAAFAIEIKTHKVHPLGITEHPAGGWVVQLARSLAGDLEDAGHRCRHLIRDRDAKFTAAFDAVFASFGIKIALTAPQARSTSAEAASSPAAVTAIASPRAPRMPHLARQAPHHNNLLSRGERTKRSQLPARQMPARGGLDRIALIRPAMSARWSPATSRPGSPGATAPQWHRSRR